MYIGILKAGFISAVTLCTATIAKRQILKIKAHPVFFYRGELANAIISFFEKTGIEYDNTISLASAQPIIKEIKIKI
jgi:hypothetical protein